MQLHLIRSATLRLTYNDHLLLIDPDLAPKHSRPPLVKKEDNPTADLPCTPQEAVTGIERLIVSHLHRDHWDAVAQEVVPKDVPLYCQPGDEEIISGQGFTHVEALQDRAEWGGITFIRTPGQHGSGIWAERMGNVMGFILRAEGEPTVYWTGDTIFYDPVYTTIRQHQPDVIITHSCGALFEENSPIVMDTKQTVAVCRAAPNAKVVAVHMEAFDHSTVTRAQLRAHADAGGISPDRLLIPDNGQILTL